MTNTLSREAKLAALNRLAEFVATMHRSGFMSPADCDDMNAEGYAHAKADPRGFVEAWAPEAVPLAGDGPTTARVPPTMAEEERCH